MNHDLGAFLKNARLRENLTLQEVADMAQTSKSYVHEIEAGKSAPSLLIAARLSMALDVSVSSMAAHLLKGQLK